MTAARLLAPFSAPTSLGARARRSTLEFGRLQQSARRASLAVLLAGAALGMLGLAPQVVVAKSASPEQTVTAAQTAKTAALAPVALAALPKGARDTHALILNGGPFPYSKDGTAFGNREALLPKHPRGYYREYTVRTPGSRDRGARRIVCGAQKAPTAPDNCYYTDDHYSSFKKIVP